jgi:hypothetical protein
MSMAKARSPQYPVIGLGEALGKAKAIYGADYQNRISKAVVARHMGFNSLNGKSLGMIAALTRFGLLEGRGDDCRISDRAVTIIAHPAGSPERIEAIRTAATSPAIFQELEQRSPDGKGSDEGLRAYLMTNKFIPDAADTVIRSYRETQRVVATEAKGYDSTVEAEAPAGVEAKEKTAAQGVHSTPPPPPPPFPPQPPKTGLALMEGERVVFTEESDLQRYVKLIASGEVDETLLDALSDYVKRQRRRLGLSEKTSDPHE